MRNIKKLIRDIKVYAKQREIVRYWIILLFAALTLTAIILFASKTAAASLTIVVFLALAAAATMTVARLLGLINEARVREQEFQSLIESLREGVITYDTNLKVLKINKAAEKIIELQSPEIIGRTIEPSLIKNPRFRTIAQLMFPSLAPTIAELSESGVWPQIVSITLEDPHREFRISLNKVLDKHGNHIGFLKLVKDITREKAILQSKSEFINVAAHQLRTPLTTINWSLESLTKLVGDDRKDIKNILEETLGLSERTLKIANDLLDASKIEEGRFGYTLDEIDLIQVLKEIIGMILPLAKQYSVRVYFDPQGTDKVTVQADKSRLATAILNLLDNAIRYNVKNGKVVVSVTRLIDKPFVKVSVEDSGIGIPERDLPKLFQRFYRSANAVQIEPNGNGLGLFIVKNIIKRHGGDIGIQSTVNRGSTFWFTLPLDPDLIPTKEIAYEETI